MTQSRRGDWMQTAGGGQFWPLDPRPDEISIDDIAHALSMLCRYGGHCRRFYSVAEHCVLLARITPPPHKRWALLHDASEAYLADIVRPLKPYLPGYHEIEEQVMRAVCLRFGLDVEMPDIVKHLDRRILNDERLQNMAPAPQPWATEDKPVGVPLQFWSPQRAKAEFMAAYMRYFKPARGAG